MNSQFLDVNSNAFTEYGSGDIASLFTQPDALFAASLSSPVSTKASAVDTWGNVKIPMLETMNSSTVDNDGWMSTNVDNMTYASLIGLPISPLPADAKINFYVETAYWYLTCSSLRLIEDLTPCYGRFEEGYYPNSTAINGSVHGMELYSEQRDPSPLMISTGDYRHLDYCGWNADYTCTGAKCTMAMSYVEITVEFYKQACSVYHIRRSRIRHPSTSWTQLDYETDGCLWFAVPLVSSLGTLHDAVVTPFQGCLMQPSDPFNTSSIVPVRDLKPGVFAIRLSQILNTFWFSMLGANSIQSGVNNHNLNATATSLGAGIQLTPTVSQQLDRVISCDNGWLTVLFLAVLALIALNILGITATILSTGPELGFCVSSMAKDSDYIKIPSGGSTLGAAARARLLKDMRLKYGGVAIDNGVGLHRTCDC